MSKEIEYKEIRVEEIQPGDEVKVDGYGWYSTMPNEKLWCEFISTVVYTDVVGLNERDVVIGLSKVHYRRSSIVTARRRVEKVEEKPKPSHNHAWVGNVSVSGFRCGLCGVEVATIDGVIARGVGTCNAKPIEPPKQEKCITCGWSRPCPYHDKPKPSSGEWRCKSACATKTIPTSCSTATCAEVYRASTSSWSADTRKVTRRQGRKWELTAGAKVKIVGFGQRSSGYAYYMGDCPWTVEEYNSNLSFLSVAQLEVMKVEARQCTLIDRRKQQGDRRKS